MILKGMKKTKKYFFYLTSSENVKIYCEIDL
jgi:hypothetical protein